MGNERHMTEDEFYAQEEARGDLAFAPTELKCYECGGFDGSSGPMRKVVKLGRVVEERRDATQTYVLSCGHITI